MHPTPARPGEHARRLPRQLTAKGTFLQFYDPDGTRHGIPTYPYRWAPGPLHHPAAPRPRACAPAGSPSPPRSCGTTTAHAASPTSTAPTSPCPKRQATPAQLAAIGKALAARRTCAVCGTEKPYCMPRSTGQCNDCTYGGSR